MLDCGYRLDLVVEEKVIVEVKSIASAIAIHEAQFLSYLKLAGCQVGLLINFIPKLTQKLARRRVQSAANRFPRRG
jgi:GxxExxY protein